MVIVRVVITTIFSALGQLVQNIFSAVFCLPSQCGLQYQQLQFTSAHRPGPRVVPTGDLSARSSAPGPRHALASLQRQPGHVGDGCACRSPPETETVWGEGVYPRIAWVYCGKHLPGNADTASREPSFRVSGVVNALLAEQVSVLQYLMCW